MRDAEGRERTGEGADPRNARLPNELNYEWFTAELVVKHESATVVLHERISKTPHNI